MFLKFILAETNRAIYQLLTRGLLSQTLSENISLYMNSYILTYTEGKRNVLLTKASVGALTGTKKIQYFNIAVTAKPVIMNTIPLYSLYINFFCSLRKMTTGLAFASLYLKWIQAFDYVHRNEVFLTAFIKEMSNKYYICIHHCYSSCF